ncbi:hypothetical protein GobsT_48190 [Gemmata obscuriglobus]|uniref:Tetratricopeptide repeat protein n=1 Tax=Gemmata obscuriglobus TaxID=114 RepID=A0A2Z3H0G2_9BACT|nr:hypothetical protein [Gemmata obscuriglobus]AWM37237.1 hypothetical protein C1280_09510 [Gemmata obscuriglobus]QEG30019.1 hypothetical protein GobsT_48190 [Gemmata obscuriglobus]VTS09340.1 Uncharacterized protein OS=Isosphaera pallida (strain ATCC 43644 / DSM 9630 / IS1B) GN=Isop_3572 PE=4 SV=1 [Gemmata obscuriglobus UQM 2246]
MAIRVLFLTGWLLLGVGAAVAHWFGPGVDGRKLDLAARHLRTAEKAVAAEDYSSAVEEFGLALKALPEGRGAEARKIRLEKAKAQMLARQLPEAHSELRTLVDEMAADGGADPKVLADARSAQANSQYYMTWLMRLEGQNRDVWEPEIESSRQTYRLLAEQADKRGDATAAAKHREDLESSIRLARLELSELQGLPLPSQ